MISKQLLIFGLFVLLIEYYSFVAVRTVLKPVNGSMYWGLFFLYILLSLVTLWSLYAFPHYAKSAWPTVSLKYFVNVFIGVFIGKVLVAIIMLLADILLILPNVVHFLYSFKNHPVGSPPEGSRFISRFTFISQTALFIGGALTAGLVYGMSNRYRYNLTRQKLVLKDLPDEFKGMRIIQISDIHSGSFDDPAAVKEGVDAIMNEKPDLILFTGDLVNDRAEEIVPYLNTYSIN
jgi:uncharacterized protein